MSLLPLACLFVTLVTAPPAQQRSAPAAPAESASQFYLRWRAVALKAQSMDEIVPFWTAETKEQFNMQPDAVKADTLTMMRRFYGMQTDVRVVRNTPTAGGATLSLEALDGDKKPIVSVVDVVKENGAWKMTAAVERWHPKPSGTPH